MVLCVSKKQVGGNNVLMNTIRQIKINIGTNEPYYPWQNCVKNMIGLLNKLWNKNTQWNNSLQRVRGHALVYNSEIISQNFIKAGNQNCWQKLTGETIDIYEHCDLIYYDCVWWWYILNDEIKHEKPGRWLVVSHRVGDFFDTGSQR